MVPVQRVTGSGSSRPRVLLTGFEPFGGAAQNPSWLAVRALHGRRVAGHVVHAALLPTAFDASWPRLAALIERRRPALVLCVGQAGGRAAISLERVALNLDDAPLADNAGARPVERPIAPDGPAAYFARLPLRAMLGALGQAGIAAEISLSAGSFVCNHVFYALLHAIATRPDWAGLRGGFVHVPWLPGQGEPSMPLPQLVRGLRVVLRSALERAAGPPAPLQSGA